MEKVLHATLTKIVKKSSRKHKDLRAACEGLLAKCTSPESFNPEDVFRAFELTFQTQNSKMVEMALEGLEKMVAHDYLPWQHQCANGKQLIDWVVENVCSCFEHPDQDDNVHIQLIKVLLTAVSSKTCGIHEASLRVTVRTVFNISLISKNRAIQTSAKGALTQIVNLVIQRMEVSPDAITVPEDTPRPDANENDFDMPVPSDDVTEPVDLIPESLETELFCKSIVVAVTNRVLDPVLAKGSEATLGKMGDYGYCHECNKPAPHFCLQTKTSSCSLECRSLHLDRVSKRQGINRDDMEDSIETTGESGGAFQNMMQRDAFLIFRALCKLSMKPVAEGVSIDSVQMRQKILSLELLLSMLKHSGAVFRRTEKFILAVKQYLCVSLLKNSVSSVVLVFKLSLNIFLILVTFFKLHLKTEIGVFFSNIFLRVLETANSSFNHKLMVLNVFFKVCQDSQTIVDVFLNYDCDLDHLDVFERMVGDLSKVAQGSHASANWVTPAEELLLKTKGLECLVAIVVSLMEFSKQVTTSTEDLHPEQVPTLAPADNGFAANDDGAGVGPPSASSSSASFTTIEADTPTQFEKRKQKKQEIDEGVTRFNLHPKKGMHYLITNDLVGSTPAEIATFMRTCTGLNKESIGIYLGAREDFNRSVLFAYVDQLDFTGLSFDDALRLFLGGFRLPGEAQQIDRFMEKFAERYCFNNPESFASADTAYVLAYSVIMLNTDAHNPMVKSKMSKKEFVKNNRGINQEQDLPVEFLEDIYDRIVNNEIQMDDTSTHTTTAISRSAGFLTPSQKQSLFHAESEAMVRRTEQVFREKSSHRAVFYRAVCAEHVKSMFDVAWCPMLAAFSVLLEHSEDPTLITLCLDGIKYAIRVMSVFYMDTERDAFVTSVAKFTYLHNAREMKQKNIECIKTLIFIAHTNGNYLASSWDPVLRCFSQLERLQLIGSGAKEDVNFFNQNDRNSAPPLQPGNVGVALEKNSLSVMEQIENRAIDWIFTNSVNLNSDAIVDFVRHLCAISREEISCPTPRIFCMQKIVEIAYYNMSRIRIVWSRIWIILGEHFTTVALHPNLHIAMYAIDSLRQLAMKFLEKEELTNYTFQRDFLKPFDYIVATAPTMEIRELIIRCLSQIVQARVNQVKSGWKNLFLALTVAARDQCESIVSLAFELMKKIMSDYFTLITDTFVDCVHCLVSYCSNQHNVAIGLKSIDYVRVCADTVSEGKALTPSAGEGALFNENDAKLWFPILTGLSRVVVDRRLELRTRALNVLFDILRENGNRYQPGLWELIFRGVLFPIFDDVYHAQESRELDNEWLKTTCFSAMHLLIELFVQFFDTVQFILPELLDLVASAVLQENEAVAGIGVACLIQLINRAGPHLTHPMWTTVVACLRDLSSRTLPKELIAVEQEEEREGFTVVHSERVPFVYTKQGAQSVFVCGSWSDWSEQTPMTLSEPGQFGVTIQLPAGDWEFKFVCDGDWVCSDTLPTTTSGDHVNHGLRVVLPVGGEESPQKKNAFAAVQCKCVIQLLLMPVINELVLHHAARLSITHLADILAIAHSSYTFARSFNRNHDLQLSLQKSGSLDTLPNLLKQETAALAVYLRSLFTLYAEQQHPQLPARHALVEPLIIQQSISVVVDYSQQDATNALSDADVQDDSVGALVKCLTPLVLLVLKGVLAFHPPQFQKHIGTLYQPMCKLMAVRSVTVRSCLAELMHHRVYETLFAGDKNQLFAHDEPALPSLGDSTAVKAIASTASAAARPGLAVAAADAQGASDPSASPVTKGSSKKKKNRK